MNKTDGQNYLRFSMDDLKLFSQASHDRNPLHLSQNYCRKTPFGQPVVFGVLCGIASISYLPKKYSYIASDISMEFFGPIFLDVDYRVEIQEKNSRFVSISVVDGSQQLLKLSIEYKEAGINEIPLRKMIDSSEYRESTRREPAIIDPSELGNEINIKGNYTPSFEAFKKLEKQYDLMDKGISVRQYSALMCCSYLTGMEMPGKEALFSQLKIEFNDLEHSWDTGFSYNVYSENYDKRFKLLKVGGSIAIKEKQYASIKLTSFVREKASLLTNHSVTDNSYTTDFLKGKVALVTGASRGLGAAIVKALVMQGCTVLVNYHRSHKEAEYLRDSFSTYKGSIVLVPGDISDISYCERLKNQLIEDYGKLDFLILNATPPLLPLWIEPTALQRIHNFLIKSISMASTPMAVFMPLLSQSDGKQVFISSSAVREATAVWPHYVAAKSAIEGLVRTSAIEYPNVQFTVARFKKLLTDLTNTPMGKKGAIHPEWAAFNLIKEISSGPGKRGEVSILEMVKDN
ncbi:SDR family NAD(P)-dependent oxidoreductase [Lysinibacillus sphaericus]|uniref:SDR family NAD(P)-dependent oxidoreductase n=1 Tax=Lysinibacillus sphaericus TaxID=1421 RepID=UPI003D7F47AD